MDDEWHIPLCDGPRHGQAAHRLLGKEFIPRTGAPFSLGPEGALGTFLHIYLRLPEEQYHLHLGEAPL